MSTNRFAAVIAAFIVALGIAFSAPAPASAQVVPMSLAELVEHSEAIVEVHVVASAAKRVAAPASAPLRSPVVTESSVRVTRVLKGTRPSRFTLAQPGGFAAGLGVDVSDMPLLAAGEHALLFLDRNGVVGGEQGRLIISGRDIPALGTSLETIVRQVRRLAAQSASVVAEPATAYAGSVEPALSPEPVVAASTDALPSAVASPSRGDAGIGSKVTVTGAGFGASKGSVHFVAGNNSSSGVAATIDSWSDGTIVCNVPPGAGSGKATVRNAAGTSVAAFDFTVGFAFNGHRAPSPFTYRLHESTSDMSGESDALARALATWSSAGAKFSFTRGSASVIPAFDLSDYDRSNDIFFVDDLTKQGLSAGYLAVNRRVYDGSGTTVESDIYFNDAFVWGAGASKDFFDVESVALHELGHTVGFGDQYLDYVLGEVMGLMVKGQTRQALSDAELRGISWMYGAASNGSTPPPVTVEPSALLLATSARLTPGYGKSAYVAVRLQDASGAPLSERAVKLYYPSGKFAGWLTESDKTPGFYRGYAPVVSSRTAFSARFAGDGTHGSAGLSVIVRPQAKLTANAPESPRSYRTFYVYGTIAPAHRDAAVTFEAWKRASNGSYYRYSTKTVATASSSFRKAFSLPAGRWRFRTVHEDASHALSKSGWDYITVTK